MSMLFAPFNQRDPTISLAGHWVGSWPTQWPRIFEKAGHDVGTLTLLDSYPLHLLPSNWDVSSRPLEEVMEALSEEGHWVSKFSEEQFKGIAEAYFNNIRIAKEFVPRQLHGDVLLFLSTSTEDISPSEVWKPLIRGELKVFQIDCGASRMLHPAAAAKIGTILGAKLSKQRSESGPVNKRGMLKSLDLGAAGWPETRTLLPSLYIRSFSTNISAVWQLPNACPSSFDVSARRSMCCTFWLSNRRMEGEDD